MGEWMVIGWRVVGEWLVCWCRSRRACLMMSQRSGSAWMWTKMVSELSFFILPTFLTLHLKGNGWMRTEGIGCFAPHLLQLWIMVDGHHTCTQGGVVRSVAFR